MSPLTLEWVQKAEQDYTALSRLIRARKSPTYDACCFHAQQCAEKYIKAALQEMSIAFLRTHDLDKLAILFPPDPFWAARSLRLVELSNYAVETRYPGRSADKTKAKEAFALCREVRDRCRHLLNLAANP